MRVEGRLARRHKTKEEGGVHFSFALFAVVKKNTLSWTFCCAGVGRGARNARKPRSSQPATTARALFWRRLFDVSGLKAKRKSNDETNTRRQRAIVLGARHPSPLHTTRLAALLDAAGLSSRRGYALICSVLKQLHAAGFRSEPASPVVSTARRLASQFPSGVIRLGRAAPNLRHGTKNQAMV